MSWLRKSDHDVNTHFVIKFILVFVIQFKTLILALNMKPNYLPLPLIKANEDHEANMLAIWIENIMSAENCYPKSIIFLHLIHIMPTCLLNPQPTTISRLLFQKLDIALCRTAKITLPPNAQMSAPRCATVWVIYQMKDMAKGFQEM